jgi:hypothetical protein
LTWLSIHLGKESSPDKVETQQSQAEIEMNLEAARLKAEADAKLASLSAIPVFIPPPLEESFPVEEANLPSPAAVAKENLVINAEPASKPVVDSSQLQNNVETPKAVTASISTISVSKQVVEKSRKEILKEKLAAADANASRQDNMLDAYTSKPPVPEQPEVVVEQPAAVEPAPPAVAPEPDEDWETVADKMESGQKTVNLLNESTPAKRSLRPQTGGTPKLNSGPVTRSQPLRLVYQRDMILKLRAVVYSPDSAIPERPAQFSMYAHLYDASYTPPSTSNAGSTNKSTSKSGGISRQSSESGFRASENAPHDMSDRMDGGAWKREGPPQGGGNSGGGGGGGRGSRNRQAVVPPPPKKIVADPLEALTLQVRSILNKITPQTFEKLAGQIKAIKISSRELCDRLVSLIFEKAIYEQNFSNLYAELCSDLEKQLAMMPFVHVIYYRDSNQYAWVLDIDIENTILAGPYHSTKDCINASMNDVLPPTHNIPYRLAVQEIVVFNNILIKIYKNLSNSSEEQYYCGFMPMTDINSSSLSSKRFSSYEEAIKSARKRFSIKGRLLKFCEEEFFQSSEKSEKYEAVEIAWAEFERKKASMNPDEALMERQMIEELQDKLKRRVLGTIRFIGELFKKGLANTQVVMACMTKLLCDSTHDNSMPKDFKPYPPDIDLEVLCKLIRTVGNELTNQTQAKSDRYQAFDSCLKRMQELSQDRKRSARIRFSLEEVVNLRNNNWIERRQEEGPLTIDEIHRRVDEEARRQGLASNHVYSSSSNTNQAGRAKPVPSNDRGSGGAGSGASGRGGGRGYDPNLRIQSRKDVPPTGMSSTSTSLKQAYPVDEQSSKDEPVIASSTTNEKDLIRSSFEDYLSSPNDSDIIDVLNDRSAVAIAEVIVMMMIRYLSSTNATIHELIRSLLVKPSLRVALYRSRSEIMNELVKCEQLRLLPDTAIDLIQVGLCDPLLLCYDC